jgi:hypothetical protein
MERAYIARGICEIETKSCVQFVPLMDGTENYVYIERSDEDVCQSRVGMKSLGRAQRLILSAFGSTTCFNSVKVVIHELMHTLGFFHEHSRKDRDQYVEIHLENLANSSFGI